MKFFFPALIIIMGFGRILNGQNSEKLITLKGYWKFSIGDNMNWSKPDYNDNTKFILSAGIKSGATITAIEEDTYTLDSSGNPYQIRISVTGNGITTSMFGMINR